MDCHSGRKNGLSITVQLDAQADFTNLPFIDPHYHASGGTLHGKSGYHFPGTTYAFYSSNSHRTHRYRWFQRHRHQWPLCCLPYDRHQAYPQQQTLGQDPCVVIATALPSPNSSTCTNRDTQYPGYLECHASRQGLSLFTHPTLFHQHNWGVGQEGANTMGAAFNYVLLLKRQRGLCPQLGLCETTDL